MNASYWRLLCVILINVVFFPLCSFCLLFNSEEQEFLKTLFYNIRNKLKKNKIDVPFA